MGRLSELGRRLASILRRNRIERDLQEEMAFHIDHGPCTIETRILGGWTIPRFFTDLLPFLAGLLDHFVRIALDEL